MLRPAKRSTVCKMLLLLVFTFGFIFAVLPGKTRLLTALVTDTLYRSGIVHSEPIVCEECFQYSPKYSLDSKNLCREDVFLLILVTSRPSNQTHRQAIRDTWASRGTVRGLVVKVAFLTGLVDDQQTQDLLRNESHKYQDIVQADFVDSYRNLTYKSIVALQWSMRSCSNAKFLLKCDDDTFVNIERVVAYLRNLNPREDFIGGNCFTSRPIRDPTSKWYVRPSEYTHSHYPMYCNGFSYVMPMRTAAKLVSVQPNVPFLYIEDVYITGMCRNVLQIPYRNMISFVPDYQHVRLQCNFVYYISTAHYVNESMMYSLHSMMSDQDFIRHCLQSRTFQINPVVLCCALLVIAVIFVFVLRRMGLALPCHSPNGRKVTIYRTTQLG